MTARGALRKNTFSAHYSARHSSISTLNLSAYSKQSREFESLPLKIIRAVELKGKKNPAEAGFFLTQTLLELIGQLNP